MKIKSIVLALGALATIGASAQTVYSGQSDQERRDRNREEALSNYRAGRTVTTSPTLRDDTPTARERAREVKRTARREAHQAAETTRRVTHKSANAVRRAGHKTAVKARDVTDRTNAKLGGPRGQGKANPEGINPAGVSSASPTAPSAGTTK